MTMKTLLALLVIGAGVAGAQSSDMARWEARARNVTIVRDDWGIPHISAKTDADVVFGMMYAQAEDDFNRVETNYINALGRLAEAEGESAIFRDLRMKLFIHPDSLKAGYAASPTWLKALMDAFADGLNFYLAKHPEVKPRVITRFEPWMALAFSEGSIGGDIERISIPSLRAFYGGPNGGPNGGLSGGLSGGLNDDGEPRGSNGIAIAPSNTANGRALLLINPHTSFFFREELQVTSEEGLNAYGAVTWGQFFVYQGFNDKAGWMHTSSGVDNIDEFLEAAVKKGDKWFYKYGAEERPVVMQAITVPYRTESGMASRTFNIYRTHRGPVVRATDGKWVSVSLMHEPVKALTQSFSRTKATDYQSFRETMQLHTNSSNNTIFADASGNIAYFHANFIPKRDTSFDWTRPVDGSTPATEWKGIHSLDEEPHVHNPASGWLYNTNNWPWSAAGPNSPKRENFPKYVERNPENARGLHAIRVLKDKKDFTIASLRDAAFDSYLPAFEPLLPPLFRDYDALGSSDPRKAAMAEPVKLLRDWDLRWGAASTATSLAIHWADTLQQSVASAATRGRTTSADYAARLATADQRLTALAAAMAKLERDFGSWKTPWGEINRFQRISPAIVHPFDDAAPSIPVPFTSAVWGSLASFGASPKPGTKKWYGTSGNSFVAIVEFGRDSVRAVAVTAGGLNSVPGSKHFNDQAERYAQGNLRPVYFYPNQLVGHTERTYRPGEP